MSKTKKELRNAYQVSKPTFNKWLNSIGLKTGFRSILTPSEIQTIFTKFGKPENSKKQ